MEQLVTGPDFNTGLVGEINDNFQEDKGVFHLFNGNNKEAIFSPQLARFESKTFKQIEENIQKEILDYSSCDDSIAQINPMLTDVCMP